MIRRRRGVDDMALPQSLLVDWVRVYALEN